MEDTRMIEGSATWRVYDEPGIGHLWYVQLAERAPPPYLRQIHVAAIIDLDADGCVAGIEIVDPKMGPPPGIKSLTAESDP